MAMVISACVSTINAFAGRWETSGRDMSNSISNGITRWAIAQSDFSNTVRLV